MKRLVAVAVLSLVPGALGGGQRMSTQAQVKTLLDPNAAVQERIRAAEALSGTKDPGAQAALVQALEVTHEDVQAAARSSLAKGGGATRLTSVLKDGKKPPEERRRAARALRHLKDSGSAPALGECLSETDEELRRECAHALAVFGAEHARDALLRALSDTSSDVRYFAVLALGALPDTRARAVLKERVNIETDPTVREELRRVLRD